MTDPEELRPMTEVLFEAQPGRILVGRLAKGSDLMAEIERICAERDIRAAWVSAIGAVSHSAYAYYEQDDHRYLELSSDTHHEIAGFVGNISMRDGKPFLHAHGTFADASGSCVGGHLLRGITVFVGEFTIRELTGVDLVRTHQDEFGLALW
jgi:predicted DNA-binding protein with PD1-like motif